MSVCLSNVLIRPPKPDEFFRIQSKLYVPEMSQAFKEVAENSGCLNYSDEEQDFGCVVEDVKVQKIYAAIHYGFEFGECCIRSLKVHKKKQRMHLGSLLLGAAMNHAISQKIVRFKLSTTLEGIPFYIAHGFAPKIIQGSGEEKTWNSLSKELKIKAVKNLPHPLLCLVVF